MKVVSRVAAAQEKANRVRRVCTVGRLIECGLMEVNTLEEIRDENAGQRRVSIHIRREI